MTGFVTETAAIPAPAFLVLLILAATGADRIFAGGRRSLARRSMARQRPRVGNAMSDDSALAVLPGREEEPG
jgi:hypothetical protein